VNSSLRCTNIRAAIGDGGLRYDACLVIAGEKFVVEIIPEITKGNKGIVLMDLKNIFLEKKLPVLLVTKNIPGERFNSDADL